MAETDDWRATNRRMWDERVAVHIAPGGYDLATLRAGAGELNAIEEAELGSVAGLRVLHLQCHFGRDSLILAQRGAAEVVGVDFSVPAIETARALATELRLPARFVLSDVYDAPAAVGGAGSFDLVFITWGTICWLPDLPGWARVIAHFLRPGGTLYFAEAHPAAMVLDDRVKLPDGMPGFVLPYAQRGPIEWEQTEDYANRDAVLTQTRSIEWQHPLSDVLNALIGAGLRLDWLHEHDALTWRQFACLVEDESGLYRWPGPSWLPLSYSLHATRMA